MKLSYSPSWVVIAAVAVLAITVKPAAASLFSHRQVSTLAFNYRRL